MSDLTLSRRGLFGIGAAFIAAPAIGRVSNNPWFHPTIVGFPYSPEESARRVQMALQYEMLDLERRMKEMGRITAGIPLDA